MDNRTKPRGSEKIYEKLRREIAIRARVRSVRTNKIKKETFEKLLLLTSGCVYTRNLPIDISHVFIARGYPSTCLKIPVPGCLANRLICVPEFSNKEITFFYWYTKPRCTHTQKL